MSRLHKSAPVAFMLIALTAFTAFGQMYKRVNYSINVPYSLRMGDYMLPPGKYVLHQVHLNNLNLFALYERDMTREPIAMLHTTRIDYQGGDYPEKTQLKLNIDESSSEAHPVLRGWDIPGLDGWEIIGVVVKDNRVLTAVR